MGNTIQENQLAVSAFKQISAKYAAYFNMNASVKSFAEAMVLAPKGVKPRSGQPKLLENFRVLEADGCAVAFHAPQEIELTGKTPRGTMNTVQLRIASIPDFLVMKAHVLGGRDKPKDAYDICYCLANFPLGLETLAEGWKGRTGERCRARYRDP